MPVIPRSEAVERLAKAVERAPSEDLVEIYGELYPEKSPPAVSGPKAESLAKRMASRIREGVEPEEIVDLWNVIFPSDRGVWFNEQDGTLRYEQRRLKHAES